MAWGQRITKGWEVSSQNCSHKHFLLLCYTVFFLLWEIHSLSDGNGQQQLSLFSSPSLWIIVVWWWSQICPKRITALVQKKLFCLNYRSMTDHLKQNRKCSWFTDGRTEWSSEGHWFKWWPWVWAGYKFNTVAPNLSCVATLCIIFLMMSWKLSNRFRPYVNEPVYNCRNLRSETVIEYNFVTPCNSLGWGWEDHG